NLLRRVGLEGEPREAFLLTESSELTPAQTEKLWHQRELIWQIYLCYRLREGGDRDSAGGDEIRRRLLSVNANSIAIVPTLSDHGILSRLVRNHVRDRFNTPVIAWVARWNPWMWRYTVFGVHFASYLLGLFLAATVFTLLRALLGFAGEYTAALAVIEAASRLRRAVYHHT